MPPFPEARFIETNGIRMAVYEQGEEGGGPPVVLCHGWPELAYSWRRQISALAGAGYRVIAPGMRGYGRTERPEAIGDYDIHHLTGDMAGLLDALGIERAVFCGHDWGGILAMNWAVEHPQRVTRIALMSTFVAPVGGLLRPLLRLPRTPGIGWQLIQRLNLFLPLAMRFGVVDRSRLTREVMRHYREPFPDAASRYPIRRWTEQLPATRNDPTYRVLERIGAALPTLAPPVLIVKGSRDPILTTSRARWLRSIPPEEGSG